MSLNYLLDALCTLCATFRRCKQKPGWCVRVIACTWQQCLSAVCHWNNPAVPTAGARRVNMPCDRLQCNLLRIGGKQWSSHLAREAMTPLQQNYFPVRSPFNEGALGTALGFSECVKPVLAKLSKITHPILSQFAKAIVLILLHHFYFRFLFVLCVMHDNEVGV